MRTFASEIIEAVKGKQIFEKLIVNNICLIDEFEKEIKDRGQYISEFNTLISHIDCFANGTTLPITKFREIKSNRTKVKHYEFKSKNLRVYAFNIPGGKMVVMGGYKNNQDADIRTFQSIVKEYISTTNVKKL